MPITILHGSGDDRIREISGALEGYERAHPRAEIHLYRQNSASVRIRIIDPDFQGVDRLDRHEEVWRYLGRLSDDAQSDVSMLVLLTPGETERSLANMEFDDPLPSRL